MHWALRTGFLTVGWSDEGWASEMGLMMATHLVSALGESWVSHWVFQLVMMMVASLDDPKASGMDAMMAAL